MHPVEDISWSYRGQDKLLVLIIIKIVTLCWKKSKKYENQESDPVVIYAEIASLISILK